MKSTASRRHIDPPTQQFLRLLLGMTEGIVITVRTSLRELCGREHVVTGVVYIGGKTGQSGRTEHGCVIERAGVVVTTDVPLNT